MISDFIEQALSFPESERQNFIDSKYSDIKNSNQFPIIDSENVTFIYRGDCKELFLAGDMTQWIYRSEFINIPGTDFFYLTYQCPIDARFDYKFVADGNWILDPLNSKTALGGFGLNSYFAMPNYIEESDSELNPDIKYGDITQHTIYSKYMKQTRLIQVYTPYDYDPSKEYGTLYFQDGSEYIKYANAVTTLDNLIYEKKIPSVIAVFVEPNPREIDYLTNESYANYFVLEMMKFVMMNYSIKKSPESKIIIGDSLGGLISGYIVYKYPNIFGGVLSQSGAFIFSNIKTFNLFNKKVKLEPFLDRIDRMKTTTKKWYLVTGSYETNVAGADFVQGNQMFYNALKRNPNITDVEQRVYHAGHSWGLWKDTLVSGLEWFFKK